mmetsp:Transcript_47833/g.63233  ORF Transcript_47833/g.63233 Transcript_47833/m.63233 type:complete len:148 (-) Transcript_47833:292-735(-)
MMFRSSPLMAQMMRGSTQGTSPVFARASAAVASRGGGGSWHRPDPQPYPLYKYTRRYHLEDINTILYSDFAPEFHMHLHSMWVQSSKQGLALWLGFFCAVIFPMWCFARWLMANTGANIFPSVRAGDQHAHMAPKLLHHLKFNSCEN